MPRVSIKKADYNAKDFCAWIYTQTKLQRKSLGDLADAMDMTRMTLYNKLRNNKADFDYQDLMKIFKFFNASDQDILKFMRIY